MMIYGGAGSSGIGVGVRNSSNKLNGQESARNHNSTSAKRATGIHGTIESEKSKTN
jgi:ribose 5-phosphate isomerase RpiB